MNPLPFPPSCPPTSSLQWIQVVDDDLAEINSFTDKRYSLCLRCEDKVIEGFGYEVTGYVLNRIQQHSDSPQYPYVRHRPVRIRVIPRFIVEMERHKMIRELGYVSNILDRSFSELIFPLRLPSDEPCPFAPVSAQFRKNAVFLQDLNLAGVEAYLQTIPIKFEHGTRPGRALYLHRLRHFVELPDFVDVGREIKQSRNGDVREGLILSPCSAIGTNMVANSMQSICVRPRRDASEHYLEKVVAIKVVCLSGRNSSEIFREADVISFIHAAINEDSLAGRENSSLSVVANLMTEASWYLIRPLLICSDRSRGYIVMEKADCELLPMAVGPDAALANDLRRVRSIFRQISLAVFALHRCGVAHRDLSLENVGKRPTAYNLA
jgi:serine/threonine protein kinase